MRQMCQLSCDQVVRCLTETVIPLKEGRRKTSMKYLRVNPSQGKGKPDPQQSILGKRSEGGQTLPRGYRHDWLIRLRLDCLNLSTQEGPPQPHGQTG